MATVIDNKYLTVAEAAAELGVSHQRVWQLIRSEQLAAQQVHSRLYVITRKDFDRFKREDRPTGVHRDRRR